MRSFSLYNIKPQRILQDLQVRQCFLPLVLLALALYKAGYLNLPFYWDEAWSYATAIFDMHDNRLAIIPGIANTTLTRGHPLFFYFLSAAWMRIFGTGLAAAHALPLLLSCLLIIIIYLFCRNLFNPLTAMIAVSFFVLQSLFLAQSTLLLPEIMVALLMMTSLLAYFKRNWWLFICSASLLVLTKETGMVLIAVLLLDKLLMSRIFKPQKDMVQHSPFKETVFICIPAMLFILFITLQKIRLGWWFYPEHMDMLTFRSHELLDKSRIFISRLLLQNGRNVFLLAGVISFTGLMIRKSLSIKEKHFLLFSMVLIICYGMFSVVNFFTTRYIAGILPVYIIAGSVVISSFFSRNKMILTAITISLLVLFAWQTWFKIWNESDVSLGYKETVLMQKELVNYAEAMNWQDKLIYSAFLMQYYLSSPRLGYLNDTSRPFHQIRNLPDLSYDLYIFCSNENDPERERVAESKDFILLKRFERGNAWGEIYAPVYAEPDAMK